MTREEVSTESPITPHAHVVALWQLTQGDGGAANIPASPGDEAPLVQALYAAIEGLREAGVAASKEGYAASYKALVIALDALEARLEHVRYLSEGQSPGIADWWLFAALVRFDSVFYGLYKANYKRIADFDQLSHYLRDLYQQPGVAATLDFEAIKAYYYRESEVLNPKLLVPRGGVPDLRRRHNRTQRFPSDASGSSGTEEAQGSAARTKGEWVRPTSAHRHTISAAPGAKYPAAAGRYHLYVANNCPWCHRVVLARSILGLEDVISMDVLYYRRDPERGWQFKPDVDGCTPDTVNGVTYIRELYERVGSSEKSVPVLWDKETQSIVNNESAEIIRMLNEAFVAFRKEPLDLYPPAHRDAIDEYNAWIYNAINNGAYKAGFANTQQAYELAYDNLFTALEELNELFATRTFLCGEQLTEADVRLFPTLFRFDPVYYVRFRLNQKMVRDLPHLERWLQTMNAVPGVAEASNLDHCKQGYFGRTGNNLVPLGPG